MASRRSHAASHSSPQNLRRVPQPTIADPQSAPCPTASHSSPPISAVSRWDTYLSETHCKLRRSAAVGKQRRSHSLLVPRSGTYVLSSISSWICQSRFAELLWWGGCPYPQLRCFAACSGFLMVGPASRNHAACCLIRGAPLSDSLLSEEVLKLLAVSVEDVDVHFGVDALYPSVRT